MKNVRYVVFRYPTHADFFNIYKPSATEHKGGGQSYVDFGTGYVSPTAWSQFFQGVPSVTRVNGPSWTFVLASIGLTGSQDATIYQRRGASFAIASQRITSSQSKRVHAWHPKNGFPQPKNPSNRQSCPHGLAVYLVRTEDDEFWAGWFRGNSPCRDQAAAQLLAPMLPTHPADGYAGFVQLPSGALLLDESDPTTPFLTPAKTLPPTPKKVPPAKAIKEVPGAPVEPATSPAKPLKRRTRSEEEIAKGLFEEDDDCEQELAETTKHVVQSVRIRNTKAILDLKELYGGKCQITGGQLTFPKKDGALYCEAHHLIPLGNEGADSAFNIIIVSPLIHRMLHYADVSAIDLTKISSEHKLDMKINGKSYTITWHPQHANYVKKHQPADQP